MYETSIAFLKEIDTLGYVGYIVGGYPRDKYLGIKSDDIDICTNMTPTQLKNHFDVVESFDQYGSVKIHYHNFILEVTTFRKDGIYIDHRRPKNVEFVDTLEEDLKRRDFVINTLCIDKDGNYVDLLNARDDLDHKIIRVVGDLEKKLSEDPLRMIRAYRFSIVLDFLLNKDLETYIKNHASDLKKISSFRKNLEIEKVKNEDKKIQFQAMIENLTK